MEAFLVEYGLVAIAVILFVDDLGIPFFPTSTILFSTYVLAHNNPEISIFTVYFLALVIPPMANSILFFAGRKNLKKWLDTHGHKFFMPKKRVQKTENFFDTYGEKTVFFAAIFTTIRAIASVIAGGMGMSFPKFIFYHICGVAIWATTIFGMGYFLGASVWEGIQKYFFEGLIVVFLTILVKIVANKFLKKK